MRVMIPAMIVAHPGQPPAPHDLWSAWQPDPLLVAALLLAAWAYRSGRIRGRGSRDTRAWCFAAALVALGVALLSPLDTMSEALASAHMVQHLLLVLVAAPLLAFSAPCATLVRGTPPMVRRALARWGGRLRLTPRHTRMLRHPATVWLLYVGTLWFWHASVPYGAALQHDVVHIAEHASFLLTGVLFWGVIVDAVRTGRTSSGFAVLFVFAAAMQTVFLSALLTFARTPWYPGYAATTWAWHLDPLADQQLAGVVMWIPGGLVYLATALTLLVIWIERGEHGDRQSRAPRHIAPRPGAGSTAPGG